MTTLLDPATPGRPALLWNYFAALSRIPRGSGNEAAATAFVMAEAARLGLDAEQDGAGNVLVRKPATSGREGRPVTALQGHVDMVCEKNEGTRHDFAVDPIRLVREGDVLRADGTTLGADNGIGVAAALAVMASDDLAHGPLEFLFTVDEERGLNGVNAVREGWLSARYLLNLDGEDAGQLCISCAGGLETGARRPLAHESAPQGIEAFRLRVSGLRGGHSGVDIHLGRGSANRVLGRVLRDLLAVRGLRLSSLSGGSRRNVIAREATAVVVAPVGTAAQVDAVVGSTAAAVREELGAFDPDVSIAVEPVDVRPPRVLAADDEAAVIELLCLLPHGVQAMSPAIDGLVQTSTNLATVVADGDALEITLSHRSAVASGLEEAGRIAAMLARRLGCEVMHRAAYPGWKPEPDSALVALARSTYTDLNGGTLTLRAIHAGLECGLLGARHPGLQMISFGPDIADAHSPDERVGIASVARFWDFLTALLARA